MKTIEMPLPKACRLLPTVRNSVPSFLRHDESLMAYIFLDDFGHITRVSILDKSLENANPVSLITEA